MSKEAKIGLLLGLVFIIAIAVVLKGVHQNTSTEPGDLLMQNGTMESHNETDLDNGVGLDIQEAVRQLNQIQESPPDDYTNIPDPENNITTPDNEKISPDQENADNLNRNIQANINNPAPATINPPWADAGLPRYIGEIPGGEPAATPESPFVSIGPATSPGEWSYVVKKGDILWNIAQNELNSGVRWQEISRLNNLASPDDLKIGQILRMPFRQNQSSTPSSAEQNSPGITQSSSGEYVVRQGDTLGTIAINELGSFARWREIQRLNNLPDDKLLKNQILRLPDRNNASNLSTSHTTSADAGLYQVRGGETLWTIAQKKLGDPTRWREIQQLNNLPNENVNKGQKIKLPHR